MKKFLCHTFVFLMPVLKRKVSSDGLLTCSKCYTALSLKLFHSGMPADLHVPIGVEPLTQPPVLINYLYKS